LYPVLDSLIAALEKKGKEFHEVLKSGRTHMQDAVPMRLGEEFAAYAGAIRRAEDAIRTASDSLRELGLGGSAVGTGINTHPDYREKAIKNLARISGQKLVAVDDMRYAMQSNFPMANVSSALRNLALEVIRISNDLRLLASGPNTGLAEINLPALQPGSSIMPGKINPVIPELAAMVSFQVIGYAKEAEIAKEAVASGRSIIDIAREKKLLSEKEINEILDPVRMTEPVRPLESAKKREEIKGKR